MCITFFGCTPSDSLSFFFDTYVTPSDFDVLVYTISFVTWIRQLRIIFTLKKRQQCYYLCSLVSCCLRPKSWNIFDHVMKKLIQINFPIHDPLLLILTQVMMWIKIAPWLWTQTSSFKPYKVLLVGWDITFGYVVETILDSASCFLPTSSYLSFMGMSLVSPIGIACISMWTHYQCRLASSGGLLPSADLSLHLTSFVNVCRALCIQCMQNHSHCINGAQQSSGVCCCY